MKCIKGGSAWLLVGAGVNALLADKGGLATLPYGLLDLVFLPASLVLVVAAASADLTGERFGLRGRAHVALGEWSFALYLLQMLVITAVIQVVNDDLPFAVGVALLVGVIVVCVVLSGLVFRFFDRPVERRLRRTLLPAVPKEAASRMYSWKSGDLEHDEAHIRVLPRARRGRSQSRRSVVIHDGGELTQLEADGLRVHAPLLCEGIDEVVLDTGDGDQEPLDVDGVLASFGVDAGCKDLEAVESLQDTVEGALLLRIRGIGSIDVVEVDEGVGDRADGSVHVSSCTGQYRLGPR
ncbi:hypothetical protein [Curtobacterium flaccumfaciens]|uniref:hypothetical protein n=1 Tax=Curtobacterium flaccumfaciens TaxID=2035 RepID=UPI0039956FDA